MLWYVFSVVRNKLLIIPTNPTGKIISSDVFRLMFHTLSEQQNPLLWYAFYVVKSKLLIMFSYTYKSHRQNYID